VKWTFANVKIRVLKQKLAINDNRKQIAKLSPSEIGFFCNICKCKTRWKSVAAKEVETILEVTLGKPILPGNSTTFTLDFTVPIQIRRSGRNNKEELNFL
jgi:hypothetical protein